MLSLKPPTARCLRLLERELIWFTLLVPIFAVIAFLCGSVCSIWQWWTAAAIVTSAGFCRHDRGEAAWAAAGFFAWMAVVWVLLGVLANPGGWDENAYHVPAVRLLAAGWNPLQVRTPESFAAAFGFVQGDMEIFHALFQMKVVWIFNAVASMFSGDAFTPMFPMTLFLFPAVCLRMCGLVRDNVVRLLLVVLLYCTIPRSFYSLDADLTLAAVGLMAVFLAIGSGSRQDVLLLAGYTALMTTVKLNGIGFAAVFWAVFGVFALCRKFRLRKLFLAAAMAAVAFFALTISPFATGALDYGHPLYPHCSGDPAHPPVDICPDFGWKCNADFKSMNHLEALVNAYVSPSLARSLGGWRRSRQDFDPRNTMFSQYPGFSEDGGVTAVHWSVRALVWGGLAFLFVFGGRNGTMLALMMMIGMIAIPTKMVGYVRYVPWHLSPLLFAAVLFADFPSRVRYGLAAATFGALLLVRPLSLQRQVGATMFDIWCSALMREYIAVGNSTPPSRIYPPQSQRWAANLSLSRRKFPLIADAEVVAKWGDDLLSTPEWLSVFPGGMFGYDPRESFPELEARIREHPFEQHRFGLIRTFCRVCLDDVPRLVWWRLSKADRSMK